MTNTPEDIQLSGPDIPKEIREAYLQAISSIQPSDHIEASDISMVMKWIQESPSLNKPHNMDKHLGVLCPILSPDFRHTFLMNHRKAQMWLPPGGHVDFGVTLEQAASQEIREELGIENLPPLYGQPVFLTQTLTQGLNAGHTDVTSWHPFVGNQDIAYSVEEKEASQGKWILISEIFTDPQYANLYRGYAKLCRLLSLNGKRF